MLRLFSGLIGCALVSSTTLAANIWLSDGGSIGTGFSPPTSLPVIETNSYAASRSQVDSRAIFLGPLVSDESFPVHNLADVAACCIELGDMNLDAVINLDDVPVFALGLISPDTYFDIYRISPVEPGDIDADGDLDVDDIDDFASLLSLQGVSGVTEMINRYLLTVPEPATPLLTLMGAGLIVLGRFRKQQLSTGFFLRMSLLTTSSR